MRMWILTFLLLALAKSISGCKCLSCLRPNLYCCWDNCCVYCPEKERYTDCATKCPRFPSARNETIFGEPIEPTLIDALRGSKKK